MNTHPDLLDRINARELQIGDVLVLPTGRHGVMQVTEGGGDVVVQSAGHYTITIPANAWVLIVPRDSTVVDHDQAPPPELLYTSETPGKR